ncbi:Aste57867_8367, partial [Symbiodinium microadriaticum]
IPEALQAALKAVVASSTDKRAQKLIADILSHPGGIDELYRQAPPNEKAPTAYAFLAMACKDHSALTTSATLLREAIRIQRRKGRVADGNIHNHVLNLAHVLEANGEFGAALQLMGEHLQLVANTPGATSGLVTADDYGGIINVLLEDGSLPAAWSNPQRKQISIWFPPVLDTSLRVVWHPTSAGTGTNEGYATVESLDGASSEDAQRGTLDLSKDLDLLAITFTIVKILFVQGNLEAIPSLVRAIELIRRRAKTPLHSTNIRNEHAYYMCICQVLSAMQDPLTPLRYSPFSTAIMDAKPLYVVGDSHSLSSAWTVISFGGENRIIVPKLVTGLKQYHLRSESDFYTKESFNKTIASIPAGAEVIFLVGEIDCREGLLVAVERDVYQSVEEGMEATVAIFKGVLTALIKKKKFKAYIHPILPVLDVTRSIVTTFNMQYERSVAGLQGCTWLDFYSSMLSNDGQHLKEEWQLDGTHVHPSYVALIERCLNQGLEGS